MKVLFPRTDEFERVHRIRDDFHAYSSGQLWTSVLTDSGTAAATDAAGGVLSITGSDGTVADNDEGYVKSTKEVYKFANNKPLCGESRLTWTEANTDDANVLFGFLDAVAANSLQDNGAGLPASYSGAVFYKVDGDTVWSVEVSDGGTQWTKKLDASGSLDGIAKTCGAGTYQTLRIEAVPISSTKMDVSFFIDGVLVYKVKDATYANATEMNLAWGVKNGGGNAETLLVDWVDAPQTR